MQMCQEKGLTVTKNDTKGTLMRKLRSAQECEVKGSDDTIVGFGRHANKMYKEVPQSYLDWVMDTYQEGPTYCSSGLARLAVWGLAKRGNTDENREMRHAPPMTTSSVASSAGAQALRSRKKRAGAAVSPAEATEDAEIVQPELAQRMEYVMGQMMASMQHLQNRMINLETKPQQPMNPEKNPEEKSAENGQEPTPSQDSFRMIYPNKPYPWPAEGKDPLPAEGREHA